MTVEQPLITSILDTDWYKATMGSVVFHQFPNAEVEYSFINRGETSFPVGFDLELKHQIELLSNLRLTTEEQVWLNTIPYIRKTYTEWFSSYRFNPNEVSAYFQDGELKITIRGPWYRTIFWEVPLMALISELYFLLTNQTKHDGWKVKIYEKTNKLSSNYCYWIDFGTRRRYSYEVERISWNKQSTLGNETWCDASRNLRPRIGYGYVGLVWRSYGKQNVDETLE